MEKVEQQWEDAVEVKITDQNLNTPNACSLLEFVWVVWCACG
jgi:hypothetical protein